MGRIWSVLILFILFFLSPVFVQAINGDANLDGRVDGLDYVIWLDNYNQTVTSGQRLGDFDGSGHVDGIDYVIWRNNYLASPTGSLSPSPANQVSCLDRPGPLLTLNGLQKERFNTKYDHLAAGTRVDARTAVWTAQWPVQDSFNYPVLVGGPGICFSGGTITGTVLTLRLG